MIQCSHFYVIKTQWIILSTIDSILVNVNIQLNPLESINNLITNFQAQKEEAFVHQKPKINVDSLGIPEDMLEQQFYNEENVLKKHIDHFYGELAGSKNLLNGKINQYVSILQGVDATLAKSYQYYQSTLIEGKKQLDEINQRLQLSYAQIKQTRQDYKIIKQKIGQKSLQIVKKVQRATKIQKILSIVVIWKDTLFKKMQFFNEENILQIGIQNMLNTIQEIKDNFKKNTQIYMNYGCFDNIQQFLDKKLKILIQKLTYTFDNSIIQFNEKEYPLILFNYCKMCKILKIHNKLNNLQLLLENNIVKIIQGNYNGGSIKCLDDVENVSNEDYVRFFEKLFGSFKKYFQNWHLATRWHLEFKSQDAEESQFVAEMGDKYLKFRKTIWVKVEEKLSNILRISYRFYLLEIYQRSLFLLKIYDFVKWGNFFSNSDSKMIGKVMRQKLREENQIFLKAANNLLKFAITKELKVNIFEQLLNSFEIKDQSLYTLEPPHINKISQLINNQIDKSQDYSSHSSALIPQLIQFQNLPSFPQLSIPYYLFHTIVGFAKRSYYQPKMNYQIFLKIKQLIELIIYWMYIILCNEASKKALLEDWSNLYTIKPNEYKDLDMNTNLLQYFQECRLKESKYPLLKKQIKRIINKHDSIKVYNIKREETNLSKIVMLNQNFLKLMNWIKTQYFKVFLKTTSEEKQKIIQDIKELHTIIHELTDIIYASTFEESKVKYHPLIPTICDLKWQPKKYNNETAAIYKDYKLKLFQIFKTQVDSSKQQLDILSAFQNPEVILKKIEKYHVETFFKILLEIYSRIEKINDSGRQLMRLDVIQLSRMIESLLIPTQTDIKSDLEKYLEIWFDKDIDNIEKLITQKHQKYPIKVWKNLISSSLAGNSLNSRERRELNLRIIQRYYEYVSNRKL